MFPILHILIRARHRWSLWWEPEHSLRKFLQHTRELQLASSNKPSSVRWIAGFLSTHALIGEGRVWPGQSHDSWTTRRRSILNRWKHSPSWVHALFMTSLLHHVFMMIWNGTTRKRWGVYIDNTCERVGAFYFSILCSILQDFQAPVKAQNRFSRVVWDD